MSRLKFSLIIWNNIPIGGPGLLADSYAVDKHETNFFIRKYFSWSQNETNSPSSTKVFEFYPIWSVVSFSDNI